jgi:integrase/recombinase XerC
VPDGWSMHTLRHRYATRGYVGTGNLRAVQKAPATARWPRTQNYVAVSQPEIGGLSKDAYQPTTDRDGAA